MVAIAKGMKIFTIAETSADAAGWVAKNEEKSNRSSASVGQGPRFDSTRLVASTAGGSPPASKDPNQGQFGRVGRSLRSRALRRLMAIRIATALAEHSFGK